MLCFLSCRLFVVNATFSTGLVGCRINDERPTGNETLNETDGGKIGNKNK
jgi:hypothetical protein